jgi:uncharacterized phage protein gp47/JayE
MDFPSRLDLYQLARTYVLTRAQKIDPAQVDVSGSDANLYTGIASVVGYQLILSLMSNINALLLDGAYDEDLDRYGIDRYQLPRKGAAPAVGVVRIYRASTTGGSGSVPPGTALNTLNGIQYVTTETAAFGPFTLTTTVGVQAVQAGKTPQVGANQIRQFAVPGALFDQSLQVNNDDPTAGGEEQEDDDTYRERIRQFWNTARRGTLSAIQFGALTVNGVVSATADEVIGSTGNPARVVQLRIADSSGQSSAPLAAAVVQALDDYRAAGIAVIVTTSVPQLILIQLHLTFGGGVDTAATTEAVRNAVVAFVNGLGVGQTLYRSALYVVLQRFTDSGLIVNENTIVAPTGDLVPDLGLTLRTTFENVTIV